jgi:hypothetical protein
MRTVHPSPLLKLALRVDGAATGAMAVLQLLLAASVAAITELPRALLVESGLFMAVYAAALFLIARSPRVWSALVWFIVIGNFGWAIGSIALAATSVVTPSGVGVAFLGLHAASTLLFAAWQAIGLRGCREADASPLATAH